MKPLKILILFVFFGHIRCQCNSTLRKAFGELLEENNQKLAQLLAKQCPPTFMRILDTCIWISDEKTTMREAVTRCNLLHTNGRLYAPLNGLQNKLINVLLLEKETRLFWLGLSDLQSEGNFVYLSSNKNLTFDLWGTKNHGRTSEPDNNHHGQAENCVVNWPQYGSWHDILCNRNEAFICEIPLE